jgi:hypothetical protein
MLDHGFLIQISIYTNRSFHCYWHSTKTATSLDLKIKLQYNRASIVAHKFTEKQIKLQPNKKTYIRKDALQSRADPKPQLA